MRESVHEEQGGVVQISVLKYCLAEADEFLAHAIGAARHLYLEHFEVRFDGSQVVRHCVAEKESRGAESEPVDFAGDLR